MRSCPPGSRWRARDRRLPGSTLWSGALRKVGIDIAHHRPKSLNEAAPETADLIVTLCADEVRLIAPGHARRLRWPIADPATANDLAAFRTARDQIRGRIAVLARLLDLGAGPAASEFHASIRVRDLAASTRFYAWLLNGWPKEWTHRYATFVRPDIGLIFVLMVADGAELRHDTLYHLGIGLPDKASDIDAGRAKPARPAHLPTINQARCAGRVSDLKKTGYWREDRRADGRTRAPSPRRPGNSRAGAAPL